MGVSNIILDDNQQLIVQWTLTRTVMQKKNMQRSGPWNVTPANIRDGSVHLDFGDFWIRPRELALLIHDVKYEYRCVPTDQAEDDTKALITKFVESSFPHLTKTDGVDDWEWMKRVAQELKVNPQKIKTLEAKAKKDGTSAVGKLAKVCAGKANIMGNSANSPQVTWARPFDFKIPAGGIVALTGMGAASKRTLLRLLARHFAPTPGFIYYPTWWRMRYLDKEPLFFRESLRYNLTFGVQFTDQFGFDCLHTPSEVAKLCEDLGVSSNLVRAIRETVQLKTAYKDSPNKWKVECENLLAQGKPLKSRYTDHSFNIGKNADKLSVSDAALITLARALLSSCDLLLIANLLDVLDETTIKKVMGVLNGLVTRRCLSVLRTEFKALGGKEGRVFRKKKTVILTSKRPQIREMLHDKVINFKQSPTDKSGVNGDEEVQGGQMTEEKDLTFI